MCFAWFSGSGGFFKGSGYNSPGIFFFLKNLVTKDLPRRASHFYVGLVHCIDSALQGS
jgi:hypothetical protein